MGAAKCCVLLVEQFSQMDGTTCISIRCVLTKGLIHHAQVRLPDDSPQVTLRAPGPFDGTGWQLAHAADGTVRSWSSGR